MQRKEQRLTTMGDKNQEKQIDPKSYHIHEVGTQKENENTQEQENCKL